MAFVQPTLNFTGVVAPTVGWLSAFMQSLKTVYSNLAQIINGRLTFGDGTSTDNIQGTWINTTTPSTPNTDFTVNHNLDRLPVGYLLMRASAPVDIYNGSLSDTDTQITLRANASSVVVRLFILGLLLSVIGVTGAFAQGDYFHDIALYNRGNANAGVISSPLITVCIGVQSLTAIPCAGPTTIYTCPAVNGSCIGSNPFNGDFNGNFSFWATASQTYTISIQGVGVQGYNYYYTAPIVFGSNGTFSSVTSASANPALTGFIRMAAFDQICWRNVANSADLCINKDGSDNLFFGTNPFAFLNVSQEWTNIQQFDSSDLCIKNTSNGFRTCFTAAPTGFRLISFPDNGGAVPLLDTNNVWTGSNQFSQLSWTNGGANVGTLTHSDTAPRTYNFPDVSDNVVLRSSTDTLTNKTLTTPVINGQTTGTGVQGTDIRLLSSDASGSTGSPLCRDGSGGASSSACGFTGLTSFTICASGCIVTATPCTTGTGGNAQCTNTVTMPVTFADTGYSPQCSGVGTITGFPFIPFLAKTSASSLTITTSNGENAAAQASSFSEIDCNVSHP